MINGSFFYGVVENVKDPLKSGLVQVRVHGAHDPRTEILPTKYLPWAQLMIPTTSASDSGVGASPTGIVVGAEVFGVSLDSTYTDLRIMFTWHTKNDVNKISKGEEHPLTKLIQDQLIKDIELSKNNKLSEEPSERDSEYPLNSVHQSRGGFVRESDSSSQKSRETSLHPSGMYEEWRTDGSKNRKVKSFFEICLGRAVSVINGSWFIKVGANFVQKVGADFYKSVAGQDTLVSDRGLVKHNDGLEFMTPEIRISNDVRIGGVLYIPEIRVGSLKADSISCSSVIDGVIKGAEQAGMAGTLSGVTLATGSGAGDTSVEMRYEDNGGDYPL